MRAFWVSLGVPRSLGVLPLACFATAVDPDSRHVTMPFGHDDHDPLVSAWPGSNSQRRRKRAAAVSSFSTQLMTHNTQVSSPDLGHGHDLRQSAPSIALFYNGVILGAISLDDYVQDGQAQLLRGLAPAPRLD
jgi:hypothetical protein